MRILRATIKIWKFISYPILGNRCRFYPSCSEYFAEAVEKHGFTKGGLLAVKRICKCHPLSKDSGSDPVP